MTVYIKGGTKLENVGSITFGAIKCMFFSLQDELMGDAKIEDIIVVIHE